MPYKHGCTWRYEFNGDKSAVLVLGESKQEKDLNRKYRQYKLGNQTIPEKIRYDHLGILASVFDEDENRVGERLRKARRVLNATTGVGIRGKGLNMNTCNVIFWCIVAPSALYGCESWCLTENDVNEIRDFQVYAGKRLQRLHPKSPNVCSFASLGWIHLEILVLVRKVLFLRTVTVIRDDEVVKMMLIERTEKFCIIPEVSAKSQHRSPIFETLLAALRLDMFGGVISQIRGTNFWTKKAWKELTWKKGWILNDTVNNIRLRSHKEMD